MKYPRGIVKVTKEFVPDMNKMVRALEIVLRAEVKTNEDKPSVVRRQKPRLPQVSAGDESLPRTGTEDPA